MLLEKTLESPLDCKEIKPVSPKGNQSWIFIGRTDAEVKTSILWSPDVKSHLITRIRKYLKKNLYRSKSKLSSVRSGEKKHPERDGNWTGPSAQAWWKDQQQGAKDGAKDFRMVCTGTPLWLFWGFSRKTFSWPFSGIAICWQVDSREPAIISQLLPPQIFKRILQYSP